MAEIGYALRVRQWLRAGETTVLNRATTHDVWVSHGPLGSPPDTVIEGPLVSVVATIGIRKEQRVDTASLEQLCELDPVVQVSFCCGLVLGVLWLFVSEWLDSIGYRWYV